MKVNLAREFVLRSQNLFRSFIHTSNISNSDSAISIGEEYNAQKKVFPLNEDDDNDTTIKSYKKFLRYDDLVEKEQQLLPENKITHKCEVTFRKEESITDVQPLEKNDEQDFGKLFTKHDYGDLTIDVNDGKYPAHKSILAARGSVFEAMLKDNDIDEQVFFEALRLIYTGRVHNQMVALDLLKVADGYKLDTLKVKCEQILHGMISVETAVKILVAADTYNLENLKNRAIDFIRAYSMGVKNCTDSESWSVLTSRPSLMKDVLEKYMK